MDLIAGLAEISVHHDAGTRAVWFGVRAVAAGDVESLHDDVVRQSCSTAVMHSSRFCPIRCDIIYCLHEFLTFKKL